MSFSDVATSTETPRQGQHLTALGKVGGQNKVAVVATEEDARKAGRAFANALIANATAEAAVDEWVKTYPALGELEQR